MIKDVDRLIDSARADGDTELANLLCDRVHPPTLALARRRSSARAERVIRDLCERFGLHY